MVDILQEGFPAIPSPDEHKYSFDGPEATREYMRDLVRALTSQFNFQKTDADTLNTAVAAAGTMNNPMTTRGDIITGAASPAGDPQRLAVGGANTVLHGGIDPAYSAVVEADLSLSDNTTNNVSTSKHGFAPKLSNSATQYLDGTGNYSTPASTTNTDDVFAIAFLVNQIFDR